MRFTTLKTAFVGMSLFASLASLPSSLSADELFSENRLDSVFVPPSATQPGAPEQPGAAAPGTRVKKDDLEGFLRSAGFAPRNVADNVYAIEMKVDQFTIPIGFTISPNDENLWIGALLSTVDENTVSPRVLLALMEANGTYGPAHFIYSPQGKRIDLNRALLNANLKPADVKLAVDQLMEVAGKTSTLWANPQGTTTQPAQPTIPSQSPVNPTPTAPATPQTETPQPIQTTPPVQNQPVVNEVQKPEQPQTAAPQEAAPEQTTDANGLVGKWSASPQKGVSFRIDFKSDSSFEMNYRNPKGKESKSAGRFTLSNDSLELAGSDGKNLKGKFTRVNAGTFEFIPSTSGAKITFIRS